RNTQTNFCIPSKVGLELWCTCCTASATKRRSAARVT
ncbi:unnamed protein product, partial [Ixodes persulcatus]